MKETQTFIILRDNELDPEFNRPQHIEAVQRGFQTIVHGLTAPIVEVAQTVAENLTRDIHMGMYDLIHGTDFRRQFAEQRQARINEAAKKRFGVE